MNRQNPRRQIVVGGLLGLALVLTLIGGVAGLPLEPGAQESQGTPGASDGESGPAIHPDVMAGLKHLQQEREARKAEVAAGLEVEKRERAASREEVAAGLEEAKRERKARRKEALAGLEQEKREREARRAEVAAGLADQQAGRPAGAPPATSPADQPPPGTGKPQTPDAEPEMSGREQSTFTRHQSGDAECIDKAGYTCDALAERAAGGNAYAMYWLGVLTYEGYAFRKDEEQGREWIARANESGFAPASRWLQDNPKPAE